MSEHTKGPWEARWACSAICAGEQTLARVYWSEGRSAAENEANAHLIAAAPELLASLKKAEDLIGGEFPHDWPIHGEIAAAIAKAEGRS